MGENVAVLKLVTDAEQETKSIDVREGNKWQLDHLPNAIHIPRGILEFVIDRAVPELDRKILLYCGRGVRGAISRIELAAIRV